MSLSAKNAGLFILALSVCYLSAGIGSLGTMQSIPTWYTTIQKPSFNPPNWLFGPVWTMLYTLMGISLFLVLKSTHTDKNKVIAVFILQLLLNTAWSFIFFYYHQIGWALVEIICFDAVLIYYFMIARPVNKTASQLFIPYIVWVSFASVLNLSIWLLNR